MALPESQGGIDYPNGGFASGGVTFPITGDLAELAARLGSPVTHDRKGNVVLLQDFESGMPGWIFITGGANSELVMSTAYARSGAFSMKMVPSTASPYYVGAYKDFAYPYPRNIGIELSFTVDYRTSYIEFRLLTHDPENISYAAITYDHANGQLLYLKSNGFPGVLDADLTLSHQPNIFHTLKFVVDFENDIYNRVVLDHYTYGNLNYGLQVFENAEAPYCRMQIKNYAINDEQPAVYIDDFTVTQNEPER